MITLKSARFHGCRADDKRAFDHLRRSVHHVASNAVFPMRKTVMLIAPIYPPSLKIHARQQDGTDTLCGIDAAQWGEIATQTIERFNDNPNACKACMKAANE